MNLSLPRIIDERAINRGPKVLDYTEKIENLSLALNAARCHGANLGAIDLNEVYNGNSTVVLDFVWQIILIGFIQDINIHCHPEILDLKKTGETADEVKELSPKDIIIRYINFHLAKSGLRYTVSDFEEDFRDCIVYAHLIYRIAPADIKNKLVLPETITKEKFSDMRSSSIIENLKLLNADSFLTEDDLKNGSERKDTSAKLHLATVAHLFRNFPGDLPSTGIHRGKTYSATGEGLDEYVCRNFLNSFDINPFTNHLLVHCRNGLKFNQIFDVLRPGIGNGLRFNNEFDGSRSHPQRVQNCTKIAKLAETYPLSVGSNLDPEKMARSDKMTILGLLTEIMIMYMSKNQWNEKEAVDWVNEQLVRSNKRIAIHNFGDRAIAEESIFVDILDAASPGCINRSYLNNNRLQNAKYYISIAWKSGLAIYTLPEQFVENDATFIAMAFASLIPY